QQRALGRRHPRGGRDGAERPRVVRSRGRLRQQQAPRGGALHAARSVSPQLRGHDRGPISLLAAVEDQPAAVQENGKERTAAGVQVRGVRRRTAVRAVQETTCKVRSISEMKKVLWAVSIC